jgi:glycerol-3-phosphate acyltransferase PlsY
MTFSFNHHYHCLCSKWYSTAHFSSKHIQLVICLVISQFLCHCAHVFLFNYDGVKAVVSDIGTSLSFTWFLECATFGMVPAVLQFTFCTNVYECDERYQGD